MKLQPKAIQFLLTLTILAPGLPGCATRDLNPPQARANTGYVDFHANPSAALSWDVARFDDHTQTFKGVFSELASPPDGILRLAFAPGRHRLRVAFLNRVITEPVEVQVEVQDGKITPVCVTLTETGTAQVQTKEQHRGGTARGHYGRRTKFGSEESTMYRLSAAADAPVPYQVKERTSYAP